MPGRGLHHSNHHPKEHGTGHGHYLGFVSHTPLMPPSQDPHPATYQNPTGYTAPPPPDFASVDDEIPIA